jgi:6-phosphofructo-2-kinase
MDPDDAMKDFLARIAAYKKVYEPLQKEEGVSFIRLTNAGEELLTYQCSGYTLGRISWLMGRLVLSYLTTQYCYVSLDMCRQY